jgi:Xaa-Pro aminopeptidase
MRLIKSPAEVAVLREAARISQLGLMEAMRTSRPGVYEYEIVAAAEYEFRYHNAFGPGYFPICASGENGHWGHYHTVQSQLGPSEFVLFDYGPDYQYYLSDLTRMWPSNGKFTSRQLEMYSIYLRFYRALESSLGPGRKPADVIREAAEKMDRVLADFTFRDPKIRLAASAFVEHFRKDKFPGHGIGLEIHDPPVPYREPTVVWETLQPGMVITIEPIMRIPDERIMLRLEDIYVITDTGFDKLSTLAPVEPAAIERLMREQGPTRAHARDH